MQGIGQLLWKLREKEGIRQKQLCLGISSVSKFQKVKKDSGYSSSSDILPCRYAG